MKSITRILEIIGSLDRDSPKRTQKRTKIVLAFLRDPFLSYREIGDRFGITWRAAYWHIRTAAAEHREIWELMQSEQRKLAIRQRAQRKRRYGK